MTIKTRNPSIHGRELRDLVLNAIPTLADVLIHGDSNDPHRVMRAFFDYATEAIKKEDIPAVVSCFRLTKQLLELGDERDIFVTSAIWASYLHRFQRNDPTGLKMFEQIDPQIRGTMYSPFTFPHTWLREKKIDLPGADRWQTWLTVDRQVESEARLIRQVACCGHFAVVKLRLEPMLEERSILFRNCLDDSKDAPLVYLEAVIEGVTSALTERSEVDRGVSYLRVDLHDLRYQPVDSRTSDFVITARQAVEQCVTEAELVEI